jgi:hypothetical protein
MSYYLIYDKKNYLVKLKIYGTEKENKDKSYISENKILIFCKEKNSSNLLIDLRYLNKKYDRVYNYFKIGKNIAKKFIGIKIAYLLPVNFKSKEINKSNSEIENNMNNIFKEFTSIENAIDWFHKY